MCKFMEKGRGEVMRASERRPVDDDASLVWLPDPLRPISAVGSWPKGFGYCNRVTFTRLATGERKNVVAECPNGALGLTDGGGRTVQFGARVERKVARHYACRS